MEKENQRIALTRRLLKENLMELLQEKPIGKISVTELCQRAEINRSTFYAHYSAPQDVLLEIKRDSAAQIAESLRSLDKNAASKDKFLRICEWIAANAELEKIILSNSDDDEATEAAFGNMFDIWNVAASFTNGMDDDARRLVTVFLHQGLFRAIREWITREIPKTPAEMAEIFDGILFNRPDSSQS
ncbi:MAG: TetR/AcrR family transcriptional regulator [Oscillospiraceae bacterium]|nr:TetR/AcrR family transcriptional regulator [Oscillospiraceae bacterium]